MMTLQQAKNYAKNMEALHNVKWVVFKVPADSPAASMPGATGQYHCCRESEKADYAAGGCDFNIDG